jgi:hypothetical protein
MRNALILLPLALFAAPACAQSNAIQLPPELTDPQTAYRLSDAMQALSKIVLDLKVGEVQAALEGRKATAAEKKMTIRDLGHIDDKQLQRKIAEARPQIEQSMKALQKSLPELMSSLEQAQHSLDRAVANIPDPTYPKR